MIPLAGNTPEERLRLNHVVDPEYGCWRWTGGTRGRGYGAIRSGGGGPMVPVHRLAYELWVGPIPDGYVVDHVWARGCRHKDCIRPDHLEAVTQGENSRRWGVSVTECRHGHALTEANVYVDPRGKRNCRTCRREAGARHDAKRREQAVMAR